MTIFRLAAGVAFAALSLAACTPPASQPVAQPVAQQSPASQPVAGQTQAPTSSTEQPVAPETSPPGDIPDNQVFVTFVSPTGGYQLQVPQGWARSTNADDVRFVDKLGGVAVALTSASQAPSATPQSAQVAEIQRAGRAVTINRVSDAHLTGGQAVLIDYASNSEPDPVTGKQVRLENQAYLFYKDGKVATLTLWAPLGADNVDQWQLIASSLKWL